MIETQARFIEKEKKLQESLSEKDRLYYEANRLAVLKSFDEGFKDKNTWWNKLSTMTEDELDQLPPEIIRKFGVFMIKT